MIAHWQEKDNKHCWNTQKTYSMLDPTHKMFLIFSDFGQKLLILSCFGTMRHNFFWAHKNCLAHMRCILAMIIIISFIWMHLKVISGTHKRFDKNPFFRFLCHTAHLAEKKASHSDSFSKPNWYCFCSMMAHWEDNDHSYCWNTQKTYSLVDPSHTKFLKFFRFCSKSAHFEVFGRARSIIFSE